VQKRSQEQLRAANGKLAFFTEKASNRGGRETRMKAEGEWRLTAIIAEYCRILQAGHHLIIRNQT
jgi:hypothetical protein